MLVKNCSRKRLSGGPRGQAKGKTINKESSTIERGDEKRKRGVSLEKIQMYRRRVDHGGPGGTQEKESIHWIYEM